MTEPMRTELLSRGSRRGILTLIAVTLGSSMALLDSTVVNIAMEAIGSDLGAEVTGLQWVINGYALALASLVLVGGSFGDRWGRRRVYLVGIGVFALASALCAAAPSISLLIAFRVLQGIGGALATPGALSIIQSSFRSEDRAPAIGIWAGMSGISSAIGPFVGGWLIDGPGWRWIFLINLPLAAAVIALTLYAAPESRSASSGRAPDVAGSVLTVIGLALLTYGLTFAATAPAWRTGLSLGVAVVLFAGFVLIEHRARNPLVPLGLFRDRVFTAANLMTLLVYGAMGAVFFILSLHLLYTLRYAPLQAGLATLPITAALMLLSSRAGALSARIGPRIPMSLGPLLCAAGALLLSGAGRESAYVSGLLPGLVVFALGLALLVSPLTSTVLAAAPDRYAGTASGINNAVARTGSLLAVAALPMAVGLTGTEFADPVVMTTAFRHAMWACAAGLALGGIVSWLGLSRVPRPEPAIPRASASTARS